MNIKASLMIALIACVMLVGVAAAESPDAGSSFSTAKYISMSAGYNYIDGTLTASPADGSDYWYGNPGTGTIYLYLDGTSLGNGAVAQMYEGSSSHPLMQYISKNQRVNYDTYLNTQPVYVQVSGFPGIGGYTAIVDKR